MTVSQGYDPAKEHDLKTIETEIVDEVMRYYAVCCCGYRTGWSATKLGARRHHIQHQFWALEAQG